MQYYGIYTKVIASYTAFRQLLTLSHRYTQNSPHNGRVPVTLFIETHTHTPSLYGWSLGSPGALCCLPQESWSVRSELTGEQLNKWVYYIRRILTVFFSNDYRHHFYSDVLQSYLWEPTSQGSPHLQTQHQNGSQLNFWNFLFIFYIQWCTLPNFPSVSFPASFLFLSCCHRTTTHSLRYCGLYLLISSHALKDNLRQLIFPKRAPKLDASLENFGITYMANLKTRNKKKTAKLDAFMKNIGIISMANLKTRKKKQQNLILLWKISGYNFHGKFETRKKKDTRRVEGRA